MWLHGHTQVARRSVLLAILGAERDAGHALYLPPVLGATVSNELSFANAGWFPLSRNSWSQQAVDNA